MEPHGWPRGRHELNADGLVVFNDKILKFLSVDVGDYCDKLVLEGNVNGMVNVEFDYGDDVVPIVLETLPNKVP